MAGRGRGGPPDAGRFVSAAVPGVTAPFRMQDDAGGKEPHRDHFLLGLVQCPRAGRQLDIGVLIGKAQDYSTCSPFICKMLQR
jgi:hypothetical protein